MDCFYSNKRKKNNNFNGLRSSKLVVSPLRILRCILRFILRSLKDQITQQHGA